MASSSTDAPSLDLSVLKTNDLDLTDGDCLYIYLNEISDETLFRQLAARLGAHWEPIATFLGISNDKITIIKGQNLDPDEQIFQMLTMWQTNLPNTDQRDQMLIDALSDTSTGRKDLAMEISKGRLKKPVQPVIATTSLSGKPLGSPAIEEKKLRKLADKLSADMEKLATQLGVTSQQVDKIKDKHLRKLVEQTFQMLVFWQCQTPDISHLDVLIPALKEIGRRDIARMLENDTLQ